MSDDISEMLIADFKGIKMITLIILLRKMVRRISDDMSEVLITTLLNSSLHPATGWIICGITFYPFKICDLLRYYLPFNSHTSSRRSANGGTIREIA